MSNQKQIEVEIKSLLGDFNATQNLKQKMSNNDPSMEFIGSHTQLNHYFSDGNLTSLNKSLASLLNKDEKITLDEIVTQARSYSVRTRMADETVLFIVKATVDDTSSENGTARLELEIPVDLTLDQLDEIILNQGFSYQAKWSRSREEYRYKGMSVSIDKNAGYGYLAEFERIVSQDSDFEAVKGEIRDEISLLGLEELSQDRLQRMFEFYNEHWQDYYGTDKTFTIL